MVEVEQNKKNPKEYIGVNIWEEQECKIYLTIFLGILTTKTQQISNQIYIFGQQI